MDNELLLELGVMDVDTMNAIVLAQTTIALYEETLIAMGYVQHQPENFFITNSDIEYQFENNDPVNFG